MRRDSCRSVPMIWSPASSSGQVEVLAQFDVGAAAGHVGRDGDRALLPRPGHDLGFALVILRVQHLVLEAAPLELSRQRLRHVDVTVPISTGQPSSWSRSTSSTIALYFSRRVL